MWKTHTFCYAKYIACTRNYLAWTQLAQCLHSAWTALAQASVPFSDGKTYRREPRSGFSAGETYRRALRPSTGGVRADLSGAHLAPPWRSASTERGRLSASVSAPPSRLLAWQGEALRGVPGLDRREKDKEGSESEDEQGRGEEGGVEEERRGKEREGWKRRCERKAKQGKATSDVAKQSAAIEPYRSEACHGLAARVQGRVAVLRAARVRGRVAVWPAAQRSARCEASGQDKARQDVDVARRKAF
jgi:hypothetical protein